MLQKSKGDVGEGCSRFRKHNMQYVDHPGECIDESGAVQCVHGTIRFVGVMHKFRKQSAVCC